jgi:hypothetical protein
LFELSNLKKASPIVLEILNKFVEQENERAILEAEA